MENQQPENKFPDKLSDQQEKEKAHYGVIIPFLEQKLKYEELQTKIYENQVNRLLLMAKLASAKAPSPDEKKQEEKKK